MSERDALHARITEAIAGDLSSSDRDALLYDVAAYQSRTSPVFAKLCRARRVDLTQPLAPDAWPAVPTDLFRFARVSTYEDASLDVAVFRTSGTTSGERGQHALRDLSLYDLAAQRAARAFLFPAKKMRLAMLAPHPRDASESSLSYMLGRFETWFGSETTWCWQRGALDVDALRRAIDAAIAAGEPLALLGTSFAIVHADDALGDLRFSLPEGSLAMPTGGFKGRAREVDPAGMRSLIGSRFGIEDRRVIGEYGMTELSSQMYERHGALQIPPWVRVTAVDADTLRPVRDGETGILRIDDLANLDSAVSIQTADLGRLADGTITLLDRAPGALPRGCSLAIEEALS